MKDIQTEFHHRLRILDGIGHEELRHRLAGLIEWMENEPIINAELEQLKGQVNLESLLKQNPTASPRRQPPPATSLEEVAMIGWMIMDSCRNGESVHSISNKHAIGGNGGVDEIALNLKHTYVNPLLRYVRDTLLEVDFSFDGGSLISDPQIIKESPEKFRSEHPDRKKTGFIMMKFWKTPAHTTITGVLQTTLAKYGLEALRADDQEYHDDLFPNVQTYMHGCGFGIAALERIEAKDFNPNVS